MGWGRERGESWNQSYQHLTTYTDGGLYLSSPSAAALCQLSGYLHFGQLAGKEAIQLHYKPLKGWIKELEKMQTGRRPTVERCRGDKPQSKDFRRQAG